MQASSHGYFASTIHRVRNPDQCLLIIECAVVRREEVTPIQQQRCIISDETMLPPRVVEAGRRQWTSDNQPAVYYDVAVSPRENQIIGHTYNYRHRDDLWLPLFPASLQLLSPFT